jgi:hypothetical protein
MSNLGVNDVTMEDLTVNSQSMKKPPGHSTTMTDDAVNSGVLDAGSICPSQPGKPQPIETISQRKDVMSIDTPIAPADESSAWIESLLPVPSLDLQSDIRTNAFAQLVQGWENYMNDDGMIDPFPNFQQPLQMLQGLSLCGHPAVVVPRLKAGQPVDNSLLVHPVAPSTLRYTYSSPSQINGRKSSSVFDLSSNGNNNEQFHPPPVALDPFQRSSSTPSAFRQHSTYSAFGAGGGSAFTSPRFNGFVPVGRESSCFSTFGPVDFYSMALEDMERTSIEVQDISDCVDTPTESLLKDKVRSKRGAASRAAKFLKDVRVLRRNRRNRGGRENPVQPALESFGSKNCDDDIAIGNELDSSRPIDTAVTVFTETMFNPNDTSFLSGSSEMSAIAKTTFENDGATDVEDDACTVPGLNTSDREEAKEEVSPVDQQYQQLDSDMEEEIGYQHIEAQIQSTSPQVVEMKHHGFFVNSKNLHGESNTTVAPSSDSNPIRIQVSSVQKPRFAMAMEAIAASPSPTQMDQGESSILTPLSQESVNMSPHTTRSSVTVSSSGHTTQATLPSQSTGLQSGLSTISETDREVMEANKDAKRRRGLDSLVTKYKAENDGSSNNSSSSNSTNPHQYFSLASSPVALREGANVPIDHFFTHSPPSGLAGQPTQMLRAHTTSTSTGSRRSESTTSPTTTTSVPVTHASSSSGSSGEEPPTFVSYIDREASSDLTVFRETMEMSSQRATGRDDLEEREASPASEMMGYSDLVLDELMAPSQLRGSRLDRIRSRQQRPPRVPAKGTRPVKTPPPRGSVSPLYHQQLSPPRNIVGHIDSNISRPHVLRSGLSSDPLPSVWNLSQVNDDVDMQSALPVAEQDVAMKCQTYQEQSIEVMTTASAEEVTMTNLVTPEKVGL